MKGGSKVLIEPHRHAGVFIARGKEDALVTLNSVPGDAVYGEKRISVEVSLRALFTSLWVFVSFFVGYKFFSFFSHADCYLSHIFLLLP